MFRLLSKENNVYTLGLEYKPFLGDLIGEISQDIIDEDIEIPLYNITDRIMPMIIDFVKINHLVKLDNIPKPLVSSQMIDNLPNIAQKPYVDFIESLTIEQLEELIEAFNYLCIKPGIELCAAKIASLIRGKTTEEIRAMLKIENDFSVEEELRIKEENKWLQTSL